MGCTISVAKNKSTDQLHGYCIAAKKRFSHVGAHLLPCDKTNNMAYVPIEDFNQTGILTKQISVFTVQTEVIF